MFREMIEDNYESSIWRKIGRDLLREMVQDIIVSNINVDLRNKVQSIAEKEIENLKPTIVRRLEKDVDNVELKYIVDDIKTKAVEEEWDYLVWIIKEKLKKIKIEDLVLYDKIIDRLLK